MNLKSISFGAAVATAVVSSATLASAPAQAFDLYSKTLSFSGRASLYQTTTTTDDPKNFILDFFSPGESGTPGGTGTISSNDSGDQAVFGPDGKKITLLDVILHKDSNDSWSLLGGPVVDFITGLNNNIKFTLTAFNLTRQKDTNFSAGIDGFFTAPPKFSNVPIVQDNNFTVFGRKLMSQKTGSLYGAELTSIPTPALLPGLVGMGLAAWRKRKGESVEQSEA